MFQVFQIHSHVLALILIVFYNVNYLLNLINRQIRLEEGSLRIHLREFKVQALIYLMLVSSKISRPGLLNSINILSVIRRRQEAKVHKGLNNPWHLKIIGHLTHK